jgi:hypothetical protein
MSNNKVLSLIDSVSYLSLNDGEIIIQDVPLTNDVIRVIKRLVALLRVKENISFLMKKTYVSEIDLMYYDNCLSEYCFDILDNGVRHNNTCWVRQVENSISLGIITDNESLSQYLKKNQDLFPELYNLFNKYPLLIEDIVKDDMGWLHFKHRLPVNLNNKEKVYMTLRKVLNYFNAGRRDRVLNTIDSIKKSGWNHNLSWSPDGSVFGYSRTSNKYMIFTGRHRIAAALYSYKNNYLHQDFHFKYPVISFPWEQLLTATPHPENNPCINCSKL